MLLLPLLAVSLGVPPKRSTSALGVFLGIVMIVSYHKVHQYAADIGGLGRIDPLIALWVPALIFAAPLLGIYLTIAYVPGRQLFGGIERVLVTLATAVTRWLTGRRNARARARETADTPVGTAGD